MPPVALSQGTQAAFDAATLADGLIAWTTDTFHFYRVGPANAKYLIGLHHKVDATVAPGAGDDIGDGFSAGSVWVDTTADLSYVCVDGTVGAAVWQAVGGGAGTVTSVDVSGGTTGLTTSGGPVTGGGTVTLAGTLNETHGGTGQTSYATGDLLYASAANTLSKRGIGSNGTFFAVVAGVPTWASINASDVKFGAGLSALVRATTGAGDGSEVTGTADQVLRVNGAGTALGFGTVAAGGLGANVVTDAKLRQGAALSLVGNATNATANVADIAAASDGQVMRRSGTAVGFGAVNLAGANAVTGTLPAGNLPAAVTGYLVPTGTVVPFAGSSAPTGWLLCDGSAVSRSTYGDLNTLLSAASYPFGSGDGSTTFNVPDMRGRSPLGAGTGSGLTARTLGTNYGAETTSVTLLAMNMPSGVMYVPSGTGTNAVQSGASFFNYVATAFVAGSATAFSVAVVHPTKALNFIIKT